MDDLQHVFGEGGLLSQHVDGYHPRDAQLEMAESIQEALTDTGLLITEAGTGTGKTYAYLVPAILSGQKVFVSTGTKNLQDQLFEKDLPKLREALAVPFTASILKGRSNYLCPHRLKNAQAIGSFNPGDASRLYEVQQWAEQSRTGDLTESGLLESGSHLWPQITSTVDNCLGQSCPEFSDCYVYEARRQSQEADLVVINHHLLMSDLALKAAGQGEVLPEAEAFIIDEAHQLPAIASQFLGQRLSSHQLNELVRDAIAEAESEAPDDADIPESAQQLSSVITQAVSALCAQPGRFAWSVVKETRQLNDILDSLTSKLDDLLLILELAAERGSGLKQCSQRAAMLADKLAIFTEDNHDSGQILWAEFRVSAFVFNATPYEISTHFQQWLEDKPASWVFTSATVTVAGHFNHFMQQLGLTDATTKSWPSPFDYQRQAMLMLPEMSVASPSAPDYSENVAKLAREIIEIAQGRTFLLFTSYRAMHIAAEALADISYPLFVQGTDAKARLLAQFREHGNAVLLGTSSFWEGVDVRGEALSCVLIDKLPFASPGDPVLEARIKTLKEGGGNPFQSIQIPAAVIQLKQGIGRLIRDDNDAGLLVLCDPRLLSKPYGKIFLRSLPAMPITQDLDDVKTFFKDR